jgi:hypothetical protein
MDEIRVLATGMLEKQQGCSLGYNLKPQVESTSAKHQLERTAVNSPAR